ncbi:thioesterase superfamily protein [Kribbella steppae]|uniref:Thioesterase superfamily protein n=1 Tax=Kribbella steppae TaxID=2512223 RepID=A0A4R2GWZ8_9ACTN|nr:thioesterase superfamily protein [Kribbella steppae]
MGGTRLIVRSPSAEARTVTRPWQYFAFYTLDGDFLRPSPLTAGPWDARLQHGGPPAGLLARAIESTPGGEDKHLSRITCEILRPIPVAPVRSTATLIRPGARVDLVDARLETEDGAPVMIARGWRLLKGEIASLDQANPVHRPLPGPESGIEEPFFTVSHSIGYQTAIHWRFLEGGWRQPGPATVWLRMKVPLVHGEIPSSMQRVLVAADSVSGASSVLDPIKFNFRNVDLSVQLIRELSDEWVALQACSYFSRSRRAAALATIFDRKGVVGSSAQTLFVSDTG